MARRLQRSLILLGVLLGCMAAVATGTATPEKRPMQGYSRLLERQAAAPADQGSLVEDCLMEGARLRLAAGAAGVIPERQFEELRAFCRQAARLETRRPDTPDPDAAARQRELERHDLRERHRQAMRQLGAAPSPH